MAEDIPNVAPEVEDVGPKKSFWGHLNDLRAALIRSVTAIGIALIACLFLSPWIVRVLEYPLQRMHMFEKAKPTITLQIGDTKLGPFEVTREQFPGLPEGEAPNVVFRVGTAAMGKEQVATLTIDPAAKPADTSGIRLHNFSPTEGFLVAFHVAIYAALAVSSPFWIFFMGGFILPALNLKERSVIFQWLGWSAFLFLAGQVAFVELERVGIEIYARLKRAPFRAFNLQIGGRDLPVEVRIIHRTAHLAGKFRRAVHVVPGDTIRSI